MIATFVISSHGELPPGLQAKIPQNNIGSILLNNSISSIQNVIYVPFYFSNLYHASGDQCFYFKNFCLHLKCLQGKMYKKWQSSLKKFSQIWL
jgi:hypothetical protein